MDARQFILEKIKELNIQQQQFKFVHENLTEKEKNVLNKLRQKKLEKKEDKDPQKFMLLNSMNPIDENIKKHKLQEAARNKRLLEQRLEEIHKMMGQIEVPLEIQKQLDEIKKQQEFINLKKSLHKPTPEEIALEKEKAEKAAQFAKEMTEKSKQLRQIRKAEMKRIKEKLKKKLEKQNEIQEKKKEQELEERKKKNEQHFKKLQDERQQRQNDLLKFEEENKSKTKVKPLYQKLEESFNKKIEMTELEKRKAMLAQKREVFFKVKDLDLKSHDEQYFQIQQEREQERNRKIREMKQQEIDYMQQIQENFQVDSYAYLEQEREQQNTHELQMQEKRMIQERIQEYNKKVKTEIQVKMNQKKVKELEDLKLKLKHPVKQADYQGAKEKAKKFLKEELKAKLKKPPKTQRDSLSTINTETPVLNQTLTEKQNKSFDRDNLKPMQRNETSNSLVYDKNLRRQQRQKEKENAQKKQDSEAKLRDYQGKDKQVNIKKQKYIDYLHDEKNKNLTSRTIQEINYEDVLKKQDLSEQQKLKLIKKQAKKLEDLAKRKELKLGGSIELRKGKDVQTSEQVNNLYLNSIKAKLAALEQITI